MNKQIEEMARDLCRLSCKCEECQTVLTMKKDRCKAKIYAKRAYEKGYCKQSEGEWTYSENGKTMKCTRCRLRMKTYDVRRYCPNCGAKMKGGE